MISFVVNPRSGRNVKVGSKTYRKLVEENVIQPRIVPLAPAQEQAQAPNGPISIKVRNPLSGAQVIRSGAVYSKLLKQGVVFNNEGIAVFIPPDLAVNVQIAANANAPVKDAVINPKSGRSILKSGTLYKKLLSEGVVFHDDDVNQPMPQVRAIPVKPCLNNETYVLQMPTNEIELTDLFQTPGGHCFSIEEIINWINSGTFNNRNPYVNKDELFGADYKTTLNKYPVLIEALSAYFEEAWRVRELVTDTLHAHMNILYKLGSTGRICYYDQLYSQEVNNSSGFEYSIHAISELAEAIESLPNNERTIINGMMLNEGSYRTLESLINDANNGNICIHGVGSLMINSFIQHFMRVESKYQTIQYEPIKCGMYFILKTNYVSLYNMENRLISTTVSTNIAPHFMKPSRTRKTSMLWTMEQTREKEFSLSKTYEAVCKNSSDTSSLNTVDKWSDIEDWRKINIDNYCYDILFLIRTMTDQLNTNIHTNPAPRYPNNMFTNKPLTINNLINIRRRIRNNYFTVSMVLTNFLNNSDTLWSDDIVYVNSNEWKNKCVTFFERELRCARYLLSKDAETHEYVISGYWADKAYAINEKENHLLRYLSTMIVSSALRNMEPGSISKRYYMREFDFTHPTIFHGYNDLDELI